MTTTAQKLTVIRNALSSIKAAIIAKGQTPSGDISTYATAVENIDTGGSSSGTVDVDLTRFRDDSGTEIGTHYMNFVDANGTKYKVILLDAQYRSSSAYWCTNLSAVTNMPIYNNLSVSNLWEAKETATQNTQLILDYCTAGDFTSTSCSHCRSQSFTVDGVTYYGQLPNMIEVIHLAKHYHEFDTLDTSASRSAATNFSSAHSIWSSSQTGANYGSCLAYSGYMNTAQKNGNCFACPVLEIPL